MSKLSFRARALDASKPLPVFRCEDLPDLHEYASINRAVPQMPTGMEKEEESVRFLAQSHVYCKINMFYCKRRVPCFSAPVYTKWPPFLIQKRLKCVDTVRVRRGLASFAQTLEFLLFECTLGGEFYAVFFYRKTVYGVQRSHVITVQPAILMVFLTAARRCSTPQRLQGSPRSHSAIVN